MASMRNQSQDNLGLLLGMTSAIETGGQPLDPAAVLGTLLDELRNKRNVAPSGASLTVAIALCDELAAHLRSLTPAEVISACDSTCTTSESDSEAPSHSKSRPSAKTRARFRRHQQQQQLQQQQQQQQQELELHQEPQPQWQQWQQQWQEQQQQWQEQHTPGTPLPGLLEQQQQQFRQSLWNGGWLMAPMAPIGPMVAPMAQPNAGVGVVVVDGRGDGRGGGRGGGRGRHRIAEQHEEYCQPVGSAQTFTRAMWSGGWQMVPLAQVQEAPELPQQARSADGGGAMHTEGEAGGGLKQRVLRCMKVRRWQRCQAVWTEWMRAGDSAAEMMGTTDDVEPEGVHAWYTPPSM